MIYLFTFHSQSDYTFLHFNLSIHNFSKFSSSTSVPGACCSHWHHRQLLIDGLVFRNLYNTARINHIFSSSVRPTGYLRLCAHSWHT